MRVIIAGGGTGGHVFPAISIADEIKSRDQGNEVLFIGSKKGLENELVPGSGYEIRHVSASGIKGLGPLKSAMGALVASKGVTESLMILRSYKPDCVIGVGGYVSGPLVLAASILRIPTAVCEQNTVPGVTNRILGKFVNRVFATFEESIAYFPGRKVVVTGNPIRPQFLEDREHAQDRHGYTILVFGGSQGAGTLNRILPEAFEIIGRKDIRIIHQTGKADCKRVASAYENGGIKAEVVSFIDDMASAYQSSDLVICRSGAGTIAELTAMGKPSVLIPFPYATNDHQTENAKVLTRSGAAVMISDSDVNAQNLASMLTGLLNRDKLNDMARAASLLGKPDAARRIVDQIYELAGAD